MASVVGNESKFPEGYRFNLVCECFDGWPPGLTQIINSYWSFPGKFISLVQFRNEAENAPSVTDIFCHDFSPDGRCTMHSINSSGFNGVTVWNVDMTSEVWSDDEGQRKIVCSNKLNLEKKYYIAFVSMYYDKIEVYDGDKEKICQLNVHYSFSTVKFNYANEICVGDYWDVTIYDLKGILKARRCEKQYPSLFSQNFVNFYSCRKKVDGFVIDLRFFDFFHLNFRSLKIQNMPVDDDNYLDVKSINFSFENYIYICTSLTMFVIGIEEEKCVLSWKLKYPIKEKKTQISFDDYHVYVHDNYATVIQKYLKYKPDS